MTGAALIAAATAMASALLIEGVDVWVGPILIGAAVSVVGRTFLFAPHSSRGAVRTTEVWTGESRATVESPPQVSVVIPALNEADNLPQVLRRLPAGLHEVVLVDGGSSDGTVATGRLVRPSIRVIHQEGEGKGDALRKGFAAVSGNVIVTLDADGSADPAEIPRYVDCLRSGADFAKGSRFAGGGGSDDITRLRRLGNAALVGTVNFLFGTRFSDLCYGYNAFWTSCLPDISIDAEGFEIETLINLRMARAGMRISEVPSYEFRRLNGNSHLKTFRDGGRVLRTILREFRAELVASVERRRQLDRARADLPG